MKHTLIVSLCLTSLMLASCTSSGDEITLTPRKVQPKPPVAIVSTGITDTRSTLSGMISTVSIESILKQANKEYTLNTYTTKNLESDLNMKVVEDQGGVKPRMNPYQGHTSPQIIRNFVQSLQSKKFDKIQLQSSIGLSPFTPTCCTAYNEIDILPLKNGILMLVGGGNGGLGYHVEYIAINGPEIINIMRWSYYIFDSATTTGSNVLGDTKILYDLSKNNTTGSEAVTKGIDIKKIDVKSWFRGKAPTDPEELKAYTLLRAEWDRDIELYKKIDQNIGTLKSRNEYSMVTYDTKKLDSDLKAICSEVDITSCENTYVGNQNTENVKKFISLLSEKNYTEASTLIHTTHADNKKQSTNIILSPFSPKGCCIGYNLIDAKPLTNGLLVLKSQGGGYSIDYLSMSGTTLQNIAVGSREGNNNYYSSSRYLFLGSDTDPYKNYTMYDIQEQDLRGFKAISPILPIDEDQIQDWFQGKAPTDPESLKAYTLLRAEWDRDIELYKKIDATR